MEWTIRNDRQSVTVGINYRLRLLYRQGLTPSLIRLGREHSRLFWAERGYSYIPNKQVLIRSDDVIWDEVERRWLYKSSRLIPMRFNDPQIIGIAVEAS
jgi:hypothetical protein